MLSAQVVDNNAGHGSFSATSATTAGESTRVMPLPLVRHRHQQVLAPPLRGHRTARYANAHGAHGAARAILLSRPGTGVCQFSDGAYYRCNSASDE